MRGNSYEQSLAEILARCVPLPAETVGFEGAAGRVAAGEVRAVADDPPAPKSAMDGFALRAEDTAGATAERPVRFEFREVVGAGHQATGPLAPGGAIRIMTGALLPQGADAVVKQEDILRDEGAAPEAGEFAVTAPLAPGENVFPAGARFAVGDLLLAAGEPISPQGVGLLAGQGIVEVAVHRRPRVALLALGDELVAPGEPLTPGQIHVSNLYALAAEARRYGAEAEALGIAGDDPAAIEGRLRAAMDRADVLLTLGGSHRGDFDFVDDVLAAVGAKLHFRRTLINWGGSTLFATRGPTLFFGLPGTPLASWVAFEALVRPALWRLAGRARLEHPRIFAKLAEPLSRRAGRTHFVPARLAFGEGHHPRAWPLTERPGPDRPSSLLADAFIRIPDTGADVPAGEVVPVDLLR